MGILDITEIKVHGIILLSQTFSTSSGDNNNVAINKTNLIVTPTNDNDAITGLAFGSDITSGQAFVSTITNGHATNNLVLKHQSTLSTAGNRFKNKSAGDITLKPGASIRYVYNVSNSEWAQSSIAFSDDVGKDLGEFTVASLPTASLHKGYYAMATDAVGGRTIVRSDGTNWKIVAIEGATVTTT